MGNATSSDKILHNQIERIQFETIKRKLERQLKLGNFNSQYMETYRHHVARLVVTNTNKPSPVQQTSLGLDGFQAKDVVKSLVMRAIRRIKKLQRFNKDSNHSSVFTNKKKSSAKKAHKKISLRFSGLPGHTWSEPYITLVILQETLISKTQTWLSNQTYQSVELLVWNRDTGEVYDINTSNECWVVSNIKELTETVYGRYLCFVSESLLTEFPTYLEVNLFALETETLAFTINVRGDIEPTLKNLKVGLLSGDSETPLPNLIVRPEYLQTSFGLDVSTVLELGENKPFVAGKIINHTSTETTSFTKFHLPLQGCYFEMVGNHIVAYKDSLPTNPLVHLVHPINTVMPFKPIPQDKPTVLVVMPFLAVGGAERVALDMMRCLQHKIRFVVVTTDRGDITLGTTSDSFREITPYVYTTPDYLFRNLTYSLFIHLIQRFEPHTLYIANGSGWIYDALSTIKRSYPKLRVVNQVYDHELGWINRYDANLVNVIDAHIASNSDILDAYLNKGCPKSSVYSIVNGVDPVKSDLKRYSSEQVASLKKYFGIPRDVKVVSFLARLHSQKRPMDFVELARQFSQDKNLAFFMVGDGALRDVVDNEITRIGLKNIVRHTFYQPPEDLFAVTDILVLPSEYEGMPMVVLYAQAGGIPVAVTDVGNNREVLEITKGGLVVDKIGNIVMLRTCLQSVLDTSIDTDQLRMVTLNSFSIQKMANLYEKAFFDTV